MTTAQLGVRKEGLDVEALREGIEACDYLIRLGYKRAQHERLKATYTQALQDLDAAQERPAGHPQQQPRVPLRGRYRSRKINPWEEKLGLVYPHVGPHDEFYYMAIQERPRTRGECLQLPRPCPFVGCRYNLWMDLLPISRDIKPSNPDVMPWEMTRSCVLDVVEEEQGDMSLKRIGEVLGISREGIRQIEVYLLVSIQSAFGKLLKEHLPLDNDTTPEYGKSVNYQISRATRSLQCE